MDNPLLTKLNILKKILNKDNLNLQSVLYSINDIENKKYKDKFEYIEDLLYPETRKGVRLPSKVPLPTCTYNLNTTTFLTPNIDGNLLIIINPYFLTTEKVNGTKIPYRYMTSHGMINGNIFIKEPSGVLYNNTIGLNGKDETSTLISKNAGQQIKDFYSSYRLVSGAVNVRYVKDYISASGVIGGSIITDETQTIGMKYYVGGQGSSYDPDYYFEENVVPLKKYGNFDYIRHGICYHENLMLEGFRMLYFPIDNSYNEFVPIFNAQNLKITPDKENNNIIYFGVNELTVKTGFNWAIYVQGGSSEYQSIRLDLCLNFECLPKQEYLNYIPVEICSCAFSNKDTIEIIEEVKKRYNYKNNVSFIK